jgi:hypothetical protein
MAQTPSSTPTWDTASLGRPASASALEHNALSAHLSDCGARRSRLHDLQSGADGLRQALAARVVTTALVLTLLLGASWLLR